MPPSIYTQYNTNDKYQRQIDKFKVWMDANSRCPTADSPYLSRANVDNYYVQVVEVERIGINADSAAAIHRGLQWFSNNIENPSVGNDSVPLTIRDKSTPNSIVNQSLWWRELSFVQWLRVNGESDPHANLPTQSLSFIDHEKTIKFVWLTLVRNLFGYSLRFPGASTTPLTCVWTHCGKFGCAT